MYELINNIPLKIKEYNGHRVVTFRDIDTVHNRPEGTARKRFNENKKRFIEGEDYFIVNQPSEIRTLGITRPQGGTPSSVILLTESGYLMLVKSFTDELAWSVQRQLVNTYFRVQEISTSYDELLKVCNANVEEIINRALDERMEIVVNRVIDEKMKVINKNVERRINSIIKTFKETIEKTSCETVNTLIPCFDYMQKKLKKLYKKQKK